MDKEWKGEYDEGDCSSRKRNEKPLPKYKVEDEKPYSKTKKNTYVIYSPIERNVAGF